MLILCLQTCKLDRLGRTLAFTSVELYDTKHNRLFARGSHTKYISNALKDVRTMIVFIWLVLT